MTMDTQEFERFLANLYASSRSSVLEGEGTDSGSSLEASAAEATRSSEIFRFGPYELITEIGRGGFGIVYQVRDTRIGRDLALKLPMPHVLLSQSARNRFLREGRVGGSLDHPGIVKVLDTGEFGGIAYIASEYVPGPTLSSWLSDRKSPVSPNLAASLVALMAEALAHAHAQGVIHRDMKPANVILRPIGGSGDTGPGSACPFRPCITDFGLAKVLHEIRNEQTLTGSAEIGSTSYMAPEQALGQNDSIGPCTDIHALGAILFRILCGRTPFAGETREEVIRKIVHEPPPRLRSIRPDVPEQLETICEKCLRKEPQKRYASALELKADLDRYLAREKIRARPVSTWEKSLGWIRRHPAMTVAGTSAVAFMILVIAMQAIQNGDLNRIIRNLEISERRAEQQARLAENRKAIVDLAYYETRLRSADSLSSNGQVELAQQVLMEIDPGPGRRDFAWNHLWLRSREEMEVVALADADLKSLAVSPDGNRVVTFDKSRSVIVRDTRTGAVLDRFESAHGLAAPPRFSRDGRKILYVEIVREPDRTEIADRYVFSIRENRSTRTATWRRAGTVLGSNFVESASGTQVLFTVFDKSSSTWKIHGLSIPDMRFVRDHPEIVSKSVSLAPDGRYFVVLDAARTLHLKSLADRAYDVPIAPIGDIQPKSIAFDRNCTKIAILGKNRRSIRIFRIGQPETRSRASIDLPISADRCLWIDQGNRLLVFDKHWNAVLIDANTAARIVLRPFETGNPNAYELTLSDSLKCVAIGSRLLTFGYSRNPGGYLNQAWNLTDGGETPFRFQDSINDGHPMPDGLSAMLVTNRFLKRWWPQPRNLSNRSLPGHLDEVWGATFAPDDSVLVTSSDDTDDPMTVRFWDLKTGEMIKGFTPHKATVSCVEFSPDGRLFATSALSSDDNLALWDSKTLTKIADLAGHPTTIYNLAFSTDGTRLVSGDNKGEVIVWDVTAGTAISRIKADRDRIRGLSFMPGSRTIVATASESRHVRVWDTSANRILYDWRTGGEMTALAFVPGRSQICAAESTGRLFLWDFESGGLVRSIEGHGNRIRHMRFLPESSTLAAGDVGGALHLWDVETGIETLQFEGHKAPINRVATSEDGGTIATVAHDGSVRLWFGHEPR